MRIAQVAPLAESIPPKLYGGTERIVSYLERELVKMGHDVTVFASGDSEVSGKLVPCRDKSIRMDDHPLKCELADNLRMQEKVLGLSDDFDIIHFHSELLQMSVFGRIPEKTVTTLHGRLDLKGLPEFYRAFSKFPLVSISDFQRRPAPQANYVRTIYHGIPESTYQFAPEGAQSYLAFLGRFSPEKGADKAIAIAREAGRPLKIAAKICTDLDINRDYYKNVISPRLNDSFIDYIGEIGEHEKSDFLGGAHALLMPIIWPEPFGLVMIEAMACGTPVIAFRQGSVPEVVEHGVTGFIVDSTQEAIEAVKKIHGLDREKIRKRFEQRFSVKRMAKNYESLYRELIAEARPKKVAAHTYHVKSPSAISSTISKRTGKGGDGRLNTWVDKIG